MTTPLSPVGIAGLNAFIDLSHLNTVVDLPVARAAGLAGVMHKLTQHTDFVDPCFATRLAQARELGLLVGAYHFGSGAPVEHQVEHFVATLRAVGPAGIVPCIDFEPNPDGHQGTLNRVQLLDFIEKFQAATGVYPMLYGGYWMLEQLGTLEDPGPLTRCPLWQGFYSQAPGYLTHIWPRWAMLQYTDGRMGPPPHRFDGIGPVDRSVFNGDLDDARRFWREHALPT